MADDTEYEIPSKKIKLDEESLQTSSQELSTDSAKASTSEQQQEKDDSVATTSSTEEKGKTATIEETEKTDKDTNIGEPKKSEGDGSVAGLKPTEEKVSEEKSSNKRTIDGKIKDGKELGKASQPIYVDALAYDSDDSDSDLSAISELSALSGEDSWKGPPGGSAEWVYESMEKGEDPREILQMVLPDETSIPNVDDITLWKIVISIVSEPPPRNKLTNVNTLSDVVNLIKSCKKIMVLTGAGVSVACGIPDFRSRNGIYARLAVDFPDLPDPQAMFDIRYFRKDQRPFFKFAKEIYPGQFEPSKSHKFVALLEQRGKLLRNYTQNIDTLEQVAGIKNVIQCHGSFATATCMVCCHKCSGDDIKAQINDQVIPKCPLCIPTSSLSVMKPDIVFFGESLPDEFHQQMTIDKDQCDLLIVIGSSLKVRPVALIPNSLPSHVPQILINKEPLRNLNFDVELLGDCEIIISELCHQLGEDWESLANKRNPLREIPVHELLTPPATPDAQLDNPPPWVSKPTLFGTKDKDKKKDTVKDKMKDKDGESTDQVAASDKPSLTETSERKSPVKDNLQSIDESSTQKSTKSDDATIGKSDQVDKKDKAEETGTGQDSQKETDKKESSKTNELKERSENSCSAAKPGVSKEDEKEGETSNEKEGETSKEKEGETSKEKEGETSNEKAEETSNEKEGETSKDKEGGTSKEKEGETSKEKEGETSKEKEGETSKEKEGETTKENEGETSKSECIDLIEDKKDSKEEDKKTGKVNGEKPGSVVPGSSTSLDKLRKKWMPSRYSVAQRLAPYQYCFVPPNRYIFNEAEVYTVIDSDSGEDCLHDDVPGVSDMSDSENSSLDSDDEELLRSPDSGGDVIDLVSDDEARMAAGKVVASNMDDDPIVLDLDSDPVTSKEELAEIIDDTAGSTSEKMDTSESRDDALGEEKQGKSASSTTEKMDTNERKDKALDSDSGQAHEKDLDKTSEKDNEVLADDELAVAAGDNTSSETDKVEVSSKAMDNTLVEEEGSGGGEVVDKSEDTGSKCS